MDDGDDDEAAAAEDDVLTMLDESSIEVIFNRHVFVDCCCVLQVGSAGENACDEGILVARLKSAAKREIVLQQ